MSIGLLKQKRNSIFVRMFKNFSLIIFLTIVLLSSVLTYNVTHLLQRQTLDYNRQQLSSLELAYAQQHADFKEMQQRIYTSYISDNMLMYDFIKDYYSYNSTQDCKTLCQASIASMRRIYNFLYTIERPNRKKMILYLISGQQFSEQDIRFLQPYSPIGQSEYCKIVMDQVNKNNDKIKNRRSTYTVPTFNIKQDNSSILTYVIYDYLRDKTDPSQHIGYLVTTYDPTALDNVFCAYSDPLVGSAYILSCNGDIIYSSSGQGYGESLEFFDEVQNYRNKRFETDGYFFNVLYNEMFDFYTVGVINKKVILSNIMHNIIKDVLPIGLICCVIAAFLASIILQKFAQRVNGIVQIMNIAQTGNLNVQAQISTHNDELDFISQNLNEMIESLNIHIESDLINKIERQAAELRQKEAELYALQTQINPHFLYNTLEVIHMKAITNSDYDTALLIKMLARLFRDRVKDGIVVSIENELSSCYSMLEIYNVRFDGELDIEFDIDKEILEYAILKDLLLPILENTIVHGLSPDMETEDFAINIKGNIVNNDIIIVIQDNGVGISDKDLEEINATFVSPTIHHNSHIGMQNVHERTRLAYGKGYGLTISSQLGIGTQVSIKIKALSIEELTKLLQKQNHEKSNM